MDIATSDSKTIYNLRKKYGLCVHCGKVDAVKGSVLCQSCKLKSQIRARKNRINNTICTTHLRNKRRKEGLCIDCGKPADPNHTRCRDCLYYKRMVEKIRRMRIKKGTWSGHFLGEKERLQIALRVILQWKQNKIGEN